MPLTGLIYLATPYTLFPRGLDVAAHEAAALAGRLIATGINVYSPIAHSHSVARASLLDPRNYRIWRPLNVVMMERSDVLFVAKMDGWRSSFGVGDEMSVFRGAGKPICLVDPETLAIEEVKSAHDYIAARTRAGAD